ncbi:MAG: HAD family hydrolase [Alphaproteobacteria bacterium]|nr:MAG: HAD family hydrolase [Alphaproteobacteria bacterium]
MRALPKPQAVIFDWDDTLVDNWNTAFKALNTALVHMGAPPWTEDEARRRSGPSAKDLFTQLFGADRWKEADKVYYDTFCALVLDNVRLHDKAEDFLNALQKNNIYMAVVSNKRGHLLRKEVEHLGFNRYFGKVIGAGDAAADKPDPAPLLLSLEGSGIPPGPAVWYVGDSHTDMMCALRAGCTAVLIETKPPPEDLLIKNPPTGRVRHHGDLMELLDRHFG